MDERDALRVGFAALQAGLEHLGKLHKAIVAERQAVRKYHRSLRVFFFGNLAWALLNLWNLHSTLSLRQGHGACTDQAGVLAGSDPADGRVVSSGR